MTFPATSSVAWRIHGALTDNLPYLAAPYDAHCTFGLDDVISDERLAEDLSHPRAWALLRTSGHARARIRDKIVAAVFIPTACSVFICPAQYCDIDNTCTTK